MVHKCFLVFTIGCCLALAAAWPRQFDLNESLKQDSSVLDEPSILVRHARSPQRNSVQIDYNQDRFGKRGSVEYNRNLHTSSNGRFRVDAYGQASRDFSRNRNDFGGGLRGSWRF